jgi:hypothetical protein
MEAAMTYEYAVTALADAVKSRDAARAAMNTAKKFTARWREAEEGLNFWQGKVANMEAAVLALTPRA